MREDEERAWRCAHTAVYILYTYMCAPEVMALLTFKYFKGQHFDLIVLDVMLPEVDGFQLCEQIRLENLDVPIMFLTAKDGSVDRIMGLKKGADDYKAARMVAHHYNLRPAMSTHFLYLLFT